MTDDGSKSKQKSTSNTFHLLAGLASGFTSSILLQPADLLKTRVQQSGSSSLLSTIRSIRAQPNPIRELWRGTLPSVIRTSLGSALYFTTLNAFRTTLAKRQLGTKPTSSAATNAASVLAKTKDAIVPTTTQATSSALPQLTPLANLASGAIARVAAGTLVMPITVLKVRYESNYYSYTSLAGAARDIAAREGLRGFFAGFGATALRDAPYAGLYVVFYEWGKRALSGLVTARQSERERERMTMAAAASTMGTNGPTTSAATGDAPTSALLPAPPPSAPTTISPTLSASINFSSSILAASVATALTNPPDAIKTRLQLRPEKYRNTMQALKLMLAEDGVRSLFDGLALRMARKAMSSALAWTVYEELTRRASRVLEGER